MDNERWGKEEERKENVLFNDVLGSFYLLLCGVGHYGKTNKTFRPAMGLSFEYHGIFYTNIGSNQTARHYWPHKSVLSYMSQITFKILSNAV